MAMFFMTAPVSNAGGLTDKEATALVKKLWKGVPDHGINDYTKQCLTPEFYDLVEEVYYMPATELGGRGEEYDIDVWHTWEEPDPNDHIQRVQIIKNSPNDVVVDVSYKSYDELQSCIVYLKKEGNDWKINDFKNIMGLCFNKWCRDIISKWRPKFRNGIADELLHELEIEDPVYFKNIEPYYRKSVKEYLERYGNKK